MYLSHRQRRYLTPPQSPSPKTFPQITPHQTRRRLLLLVSAAVAISLFSCFSSSFLCRSSKTATQGLNLNMSSPAAAADPATVWDTFYISHGSPTLSIDETIPARHFLQRWKDEVLPARPKAILVISGHWEAHVPSVNAVQGPLDTIYDFYGFPKSMYQIKYPAPGAPELANRVKELLMQSGFDRVHVDKKRGLDHGAWVPLMLMYPEADIPVCQLSVLTSKDGTYHYNMGKALAPLRNEGVLVFGSGSATHNLRKLQMNDPTPPVWAAEFDNWLEDSLVNQRYGDVNEWDKKAPHAKTAHPWPDHFYPLHVAIGAAGGNPKAELIHRSWGHGTLSYASYRFT